EGDDHQAPGMAGPWRGPGGARGGAATGHAVTAPAWPARDPAPRAGGTASGTARLRVQPADFRVIERVVAEPEGAGEHLWLYARLTGCNTGWVADQLARHYRRPRVDVGFAGRKDRHAVTEQWLSVRLPQTE